MKSKVTITLCGDLCPTKDTLPNFLNEDFPSLFNDVQGVFDNSDFLFGNLECVLTDSPAPIRKSGPVLHAPTSTVKALKKTGFDLLTLSNNHIKDCGESGVKSTIAACSDNGIDTFGAGKNIYDAKKPYVKELNGYKIGFIAFSEQEFNAATETSYGAGFFDPLDDLDLIEDTKNKVDYLIVIYHGGVEYYEYPSPLLQKKCRKFVDKGADLVLCQHSHCIGTFEDYAGKRILYGQGNTVFGHREGDAQWNRGLLVQVVFDGTHTPKINFVPITANAKGGIALLTKKDTALLLNQLHERSEKIKDKAFIYSEWEKFITYKSNLYVPYLLGFNRLFIHLNRLTKNWFIKLFYKRSRLLTTHNIIRCESHNEVIQSILKKW